MTQLPFKRDFKFYVENRNERRFYYDNPPDILQIADHPSQFVEQRLIDMWAIMWRTSTNVAWVTRTKSLDPGIWRQAKLRGWLAWTTFLPAAVELRITKNKTPFFKSPIGGGESCQHWHTSTHFCVTVLQRVFSFFKLFQVVYPFFIRLNPFGIITHEDSVMIPLGPGHASQRKLSKVMDRSWYTRRVHGYG